MALRERASRATPIINWLSALVFAYLLILFGWAAIRGLFGDRWWWLFLLNSFAQYLFVPLPAALLIAMLARKRTLWAGLAAALLLWAYLYGQLFVPRPAPALARDDGLKVMTFNTLVTNSQPARVIAAIRASAADVVALQELSPWVAAMIERELTREYPYQALAPQRDDSGMGLISRYPLRPSKAQPPADWRRIPQVLELDLRGTPILLINIHAASPVFPDMEASVRERERQAQTIADFATAHPQPLIVLGDFNAGDLSTAYQIVAGTLVDSWREVGWGLGHTFPGEVGPGTSRPTVLGIPVPMWLVRIDYIFHSQHWRAVTAEIGPWDRSSDHRPVVAQLVLPDP
jgi:vancomycin resistance protein VanJ